MKDVSKDSLVLVDELGKGTEPKTGRQSYSMGNFIDHNVKGIIRKSRSMAVLVTCCRLPRANSLCNIRWKCEEHE